MPDLSDLLLLSLPALGLLYLWYGSEYKDRARDLAAAHCRELGLQLLDHTVVITAIWPVRGYHGKLEFRRKYQFEFASLGDRRYSGRLTLVGRKLLSIHLEVYTPPPSE